MRHSRNGLVEHPNIDDPSIARVALVISSPALIPDALTTRLGLSPTRSHKRGDARHPPQRPWTSGLWEVEEGDEDFASALRRLIARVEPVKEVLQELVDEPDLTICLAVWWDPQGGQGGFSVDAEGLMTLLPLVRRVDFAFVTRGETQPSQSNE